MSRHRRSGPSVGPDWTPSHFPFLSFILGSRPGRSPRIAMGVFILIALDTIVWDGAKAISLRHHARLLKFIQFAGVRTRFRWKRSHIPMSAHWLADFLHELTVFPNGGYDDQ